ncbi:peptidase S8/S53 domain-containing protein [Xylariaceae sp. FL0662B]|nr:peptidase S8/S53 domain-containing protein [Xylariaceae sp. FL0662B]
MRATTFLSWSTATSLTFARPIPRFQDQNEHLIPDRYIVKMKGSTLMLDFDDAIAAHASNAKYVYNATSFRGFASNLDATSLEAVKNNPQVEYVEQDTKVYLNGYVVQDPAPWGIARISHRNNGDTSYIVDESFGEGTCTYMIDTGINVTHPDFGGRATWLENFADDDNNDGAGHGTYTAGIVGANTWGVAKKTQLFAIKVFKNDGSADGSDVIAAMNWVAQDAQTRDCPNGTIANMSLGGGKSQASNDAAAALVNAGVFVAVAAGNSNADTADFSPASEPSVCTVGASDSNDAMASFSNYGSLVDVFAPGVDIESTSYQGGSTTASGTSASSPIVAGLGAYLLTLEGKRDPTALCDRVKELATTDKLTSLPSGTANNLAFNGSPYG